MMKTIIELNNNKSKLTDEHSSISLILNEVENSLKVLTSCINTLDNSVKWKVVSMIRTIFTIIGFLTPEDNSGVNNCHFNSSYEVLYIEKDTQLRCRRWKI